MDAQNICRFAIITTVKSQGLHSQFSLTNVRKEMDAQNICRLFIQCPLLYCSISHDHSTQLEFTILVVIQIRPLTLTQRLASNPQPFTSHTDNPPKSLKMCADLWAKHFLYRF